MKTLKEVERDHIQYVLDANDWYKLQSAKILGINRTTLYTKIRRYDIRKKEDSNNGRLGINSGK